MDKKFLIVKTQLIPPKLKNNSLRRDRLLKILEQNLDRRLVLIIGGAGYGKTTLLTQMVQTIKSPFMVYTISKNDVSLNVFLAYVMTGINQIYKGFGKRTKIVIETMKESKIDIEMLIGTFINELVETTKEELFIILEDYHLVQGIRQINDGMNYFIEHLPPNVHLIISSREELPLSLTRIKSKREVLEITTDEIRFTRDEMETLFKDIYKINIPPSIMKEVELSSQGWITSLQSLSYIVKKGMKDITKKIRHGRGNIEYFENEVFLQQPEEVRSFLMCSSILEEMTPESCDTILNRKDSLKRLELLVKKNLFISCKDEERKIFSYHPLFHNFLTYKINQETNARDLHLRAANYFESVSDYNKSIYHYFQANDINNAIRLIEKEGEQLVDAERFDILEQWFKELPGAIIQNNPSLLLYQGTILSRQDKLDGAMKLYKRARAIFVKEKKAGDLIRCVERMASLLNYRGDYMQAVRLGEKALKLTGKEKSLSKAKVLKVIGVAYACLDNYRKALSVMSECLEMCQKIGSREEEKLIKSIQNNLLGCYVNLGEYDRVIDIAEKLVKVELHTPNPYLGHICGNLGLAYMYKGNLLRARTTFQKAIWIHKKFNNKMGISETLADIGLLNFMMGKYKLSRVYLKRIAKLFGKKSLKLFAVYYISESYLYEGNLIKAEKWVNKLVAENEVYRTLYPLPGLIKLNLGYFDEAEKMLNLVLKNSLKSQNKIDRMLAYLSLAELYYRKGEEELLAKHLKKALKISGKYDYHFPLIRLGGINFALLGFAINNGIEANYAKFLLNEVESQYDLVVNFLGGLKFKWKGVEKDIRWKTQKAKSLFAYFLANRKKTFTRDQLVDLLWQDKSFHKGQSSLRNALSSIRSTIDPFIKEDMPIIEYKDDLYRINPQYNLWVDTEEFEQEIKEAEGWERKRNKAFSITKYEEAIAIYKGRFLPELYDSWCQDTHLFYSTEYIKILEKVADYYSKEKKYDRAIKYSKKIIEIDEFYEPAYKICIHSYISTGKRKRALDLYKKLERMLKDELHTLPSQEIKGFFNF